MTTFFSNLEICLKQKKMNCKELGELINIKSASITGWKNGSIPRADIACKIAKIFNVSVEWLITGEEPIIKTKGSELAELIDKLPQEYQEIILQNIQAYQKLCYKLDSENIQNIS